MLLKEQSQVDILSPLRERGLWNSCENLMLISIATLALQQSAPVGLSEEKDWETDRRKQQDLNSRVQSMDQWQQISSAVRFHLLCSLLYLMNQCMKIDQALSTKKSVTN